jgi:hypothetical protein
MVAAVCGVYAIADMPGVHLDVHGVTDTQINASDFLSAIGVSYLELVGWNTPPGKIAGEAVI